MMNDTRSSGNSDDNRHQDQFLDQISEYVKGKEVDLSKIFSLDGAVSNLAAKSNIPNSQLRKFYDKFLSIHDQLDSKSMDINRALTNLYEILFVSKYTAERKGNKNDKKPELVVFLDNTIKELNSIHNESEKFEKTMNKALMVFEAWVAYNKTSK